MLVSQPYVVRLFGTKENLFLAAMDESLAKMMTSFRAALEPGSTERTTKQRIGDAYVELLNVRGLHQALAHSHVLGK